MSYYYLISSLPSLKSDSQMPFSYADFLSQCKSSVSESVYGILESLTLKSSEGPLLKEWSVFYKKFSDELNNQRKQKLGKSSNAFYDKEVSITSVVNAAMSAKNPLEAEQIMLKAQFEYLDSLVAMHYFDNYVLFGYAIKLKLLERQSKFNTNEGKEEFSRLFTSIQNQIMGL